MAAPEPSRKLPEDVPVWNPPNVVTGAAVGNVVSATGLKPNDPWPRGGASPPILLVEVKLSPTTAASVVVVDGGVVVVTGVRLVTALAPVLAEGRRRRAN